MNIRRTRCFCNEETHGNTEREIDTRDALAPVERAMQEDEQPPERKVQLQLVRRRH